MNDDAPDRDAPATAQASPGTQPAILVIDDQEPNLRVVEALLTHAGFEVVAAASGADGLARLGSLPLDCVLLDMRMPGMDGFAVLEQLRAQPDTRHLPVVFLTAETDREVLVRAFEAGAVDYITKPFVAEELLARVRTHVELKQSRDALARLAMEKQQVAEIVAHDLRNYFANISFAAEMLLDDTQAPLEKRKRLAESIRASTTSGMLFLQAFLEQQSQQQRGLAVEPLPVRQLLHEAIDLLQRAADEKNITLSMHQAETLVVCGQRASVSHILTNLLSNAIKYSPDGGEVVIAASRAAGRVTVSVTDSGLGIPAAEQPHVFEKFFRAERGPAARVGGTGLGLALAHEIVVAHGGRMGLESTEGAGSRFWFELAAE
jgi:two-component system sensor histidine kinase/response regulator